MLGRFCLSLVLLSVSAAAVAQPAERVVTGDGIVAATVNGAPARLRIDPAAPALPIFTAPFATEQARLRAGPFAFAYLVGPQQVPGRSAVGRIAVGEGGRPRKRRIGWAERPYLTGAEGVIGPGGLPENVVRFVLRPSLPGERTVALPLEDEGGLLGGWGGSYALVPLGGETLRVRFNPHEPRTLATAGAAVRLANVHAGTVSGESAPAHIAFGISRPVRTLRLGTPFAVGPLALSELGVRTADFGTADGIREEGGDPDEVVVTGDRGRNRNRDRLSIGADLLRTCSVIVFDKRRREVRLTCA
ncbi:MAG TPA: hypothetical protein VMG08_00170 [Allosphingosinicella sp.]|nr:hypothetical protein [Allosphingosinicella sp.]